MSTAFFSIGAVSSRPFRYATAASQQAATIGKNANDWGKTQWGVDVAGQATDLLDGVKRATVGEQRPQGYSTIGQHEEETSALYHDDDDFFTRHDGSAQSGGNSGWGSSSTSAAAPAPAPAASGAAAKKKDEWEDW